MNHESAWLVAAALGTTGWSPVDTPVHFTVSHTRSAETPLPTDLLPATLWIPPSGRLLVTVDPREALVRSSANFSTVAARALSHNVDDERLVAARVAEVLGDKKPLPLTRKLAT